VFAALFAIAAVAPTLGVQWGPYQEGYGTVRPQRIDNGGDPTGLVTHVHWRSWGGARAVGSGVSTWVWPGTGVANNPPTHGARVVAFKLGTCGGRPAYTAIEWYFPKYGERFDPHVYIEICRGRVFDELSYRNCAHVKLADGSGTAVRIAVHRMSCRWARAVIAALPAGRHVRRGVRFMHGRFRCGTIAGSREFSCSTGTRELHFSLA
jgi:hypothetical protein